VAKLALLTIWQFDLHASLPQAACADARADADRALELIRHWLRRIVRRQIVLQYCDSDFLAAEREFRRALELQPGSSDALRSYAWLALSDGRSDQALQLAQRAVSSDPFNAMNFAVLGSVRWAAGHFAEAEVAYRKAVELSPTLPGLQWTARKHIDIDTQGDRGGC